MFVSIYVYSIFIYISICVFYRYGVSVSGEEPQSLGPLLLVIEESIGSLTGSLARPLSSAGGNGPT